MLIDTHAHVSFAAFKDEYKEALKRAQTAGVLVINVGTQLDTSREAVRIAEEYKKAAPTGAASSSHLVQSSKLPLGNLNIAKDKTPVEDKGFAGGPAGNCTPGNPSGNSGTTLSQAHTEEVYHNLSSISDKNIKATYRQGIYAVVGLHPVHTYSQEVDEEESHFKTREEKFDYKSYRKLADNPLVVGIGECGLDYYRLPRENNGHSLDAIKKLQKEAFVAQIRLAKELNKALVIHCRPSAGTQDAYEEIIGILDTEFQNFQFPISNFQFEIHSFTGSPEIVQEFLKRGAYVGLNGIITFDKTGNMEQVVKTVPLDRIVLETDCPYLTPVPHRGKKNEPAYVQYVAQKVAELKNVSIDEVADLTTQNSSNLFQLS